LGWRARGRHHKILKTKTNQILDDYYDPNIPLTTLIEFVVTRCHFQSRERERKQTNIIMASFLWTCVFILLCLELALTLLLVIPVPRKIRNWVCRQTTKIHLKQKLQPVLWGIGLALTVALMDSWSLLQFLFQKRNHNHETSLLSSTNDSGLHPHHHHHHQKEKEYKTERNMYLAGFALTLLFVIGRITDLMQEHVELEDELETVRLSTKPANETTSVGDANESEIEMKPLQAKKNE
jgi:hypothetical protein